MGRKEKNIFYIYKTTCDINGKFYVGMHSTTNINDGYLGSGKRLKYSIRKYGINNHSKEIIEFCGNKEDLILRETDIVDKTLVNNPMCLNLMNGGKGGFISDEQQKHRATCGGKAFSKKIK